jgi:hypothetical protein
MITIKRGKLDTPIKTVIYGDPGVGKTTFAANAPNPVFLDLEGSTQNQDVARIYLDEKPLTTFDEVRAVLSGVSTSEPITLVIDTFDALEAMAQRHLCDQFGKKSIEDFGFGKGYAQTAELCRGVLGQLDALIHKGVGVVIVAHSKIATFNNPEGDNWDRYELKLHKKTGEALVEWADNVLFAHRESYAVESNGKAKAAGTYARYLHAVGSPAYVAKNRYNLPDKFALDWPTYENGCKRGAESVESLYAIALAEVEGLPEDRKEKALGALEPIKTDATKLNRFIDYCKSTKGTQK